MFLGLNLFSQGSQSYTVYNTGSSCSYYVTCHFQYDVTDPPFTVTYYFQQSATIDPGYNHTFTFSLIPRNATNRLVSFDASCTNFSQTNLCLTALTDYDNNCIGTGSGYPTRWDPTIGNNEYYIWADIIDGKKNHVEIISKKDNASEDKATKINNASINSQNTSDFKVTKIKEASIISSSVVLYPNPSTGNVYITYDTPVDVLVYDIFGKIVYNESKTNVVNISSLSAGVYNFKVTTDKEVTFEKIILTK